MRAMNQPRERCRDHDLASDADGRCVLCRREARTTGPAPEASSPAIPVMPIVVASSFGLVFVGGLVLSAFVLAGGDSAFASAEPDPAPAAETATNQPATEDTTAVRGQGASPQSPATGSTTNGGKTDVPIEVYSASWCPACRAAKAWLDQNGYRYTDYDIDRDAAARGRLRSLNPRGSIPVIVVDRTQTFVGFNPPALEGAIAAAARTP